MEIGLMDQLASQDTPVHRLDPRAKLLTTLMFVATVVSFDKYAISALLPFFAYPVMLMTVGRIPAPYLLRKTLLVAPFAILIGIFNPLLDRDTFITIGTLTITGGWVSFLSILIRFVLTVEGALILLASSGIHGVCLALDKLGVPRVFTVQLLFLYRYLFVIADEGLRMVRAKTIRSFGIHDMGIKVYIHMLGYLLLRSLDRAQRVHSAMSSRGFDGHIQSMKPLKLRPVDIMFTCVWSLLFVLMRIHNISLLLGSFITEIFQ